MGAQILVIEDDVDLRAEVMDFLLRRLNTVRACGTLAEAEEVLKAMRPDFVLSDINLPDGDGVSFCMLHAGNHRQAKWLLMSGNLELVRLSNTLKCVADTPPYTVVDKPVPLRLLDNFIHSWMMRTR